MALPFLDNLNAILSGVAPMNNAGGLINPMDAQAAQRQGQLGLGAGLLAGAGPNPRPVSFGQALSGAMLQSNAMQNNAVQQSVKNNLAAGELFRRMMPTQSADSQEIIPVNTPQGVRYITKAQAAATPGVTPYLPPQQPREERPQLITRPAPDAGDGMVQDWAVDLKTQQLKPVGSPYPAAGSAASQMGSREGVMFARVASSANEAVTALKNISELPIGASTGVLGIGGSPGASAVMSTYGALKNAIAPQEVQDYNTMLAGVSRSLATIETAGLAPNGSLSHSMDSIQLREGDTEFTKLRKLAEMRQILEKGIEPNLANPRIPPEQKKLISEIIAKAEEAIPYTQHDITELQRRQAKDPALTLQDLISQKGLRGPTPGSPTTVKSDEDYNALPSGTVFVGPDGKQRRKP